MPRPYRPRRLPSRRARRRRWGSFTDAEIDALLAMMEDQNVRHEFARGIEPERGLLAELTREARRRGLLEEV